MIIIVHGALRWHSVKSYLFIYLFTYHQFIHPCSSQSDIDFFDFDFYYSRPSAYEKNE